MPLQGNWIRPRGPPLAVALGARIENGSCLYAFPIREGRVCLYHTAGEFYGLVLGGSQRRQGEAEPVRTGSRKGG